MIWFTLIDEGFLAAVKNGKSTPILLVILHFLLRKLILHFIRVKPEPRFNDRTQEEAKTARLFKINYHNTVKEAKETLF